MKIDLNSKVSATFKGNEYDINVSSFKLLFLMFILNYLNPVDSSKFKFLFISKVLC